MKSANKILHTTLCTFAVALAFFAIQLISPNNAHAANVATNLNVTQSACSGGSIPVTFTWTAADNPAGGLPVGRQDLVFSLNSDFPSSTTQVIDVGIGAQTRSFSNFLPSTTYYWYINTRYDFGTGSSWSTSAGENFTTNSCSTATPPPTGTPPPTTGSVECPSLTASRPATAREAYDRVWLTGICNNNADQVYFGWGQTATIVDSIYSLLWAKSQLHPESDGVTAGTGAVASTGKLVATMYNPPVSGVNYLAGEFRKLNPVKDAYAQQGVGYDALAPVQTVWEGFRNISYVGFVIVFVIIGFMIMFRAHISPQAVATLQDSLPRIVVALILVTFSYAIAGLMIDIMFLVLNVALAALPVTDAANIVFTKSIFGVVRDSWTSTFGTVAGAVAQLIDNTIDLGALDKILGWLGGSLAAIIIGIAMLFVMFKVFITLLIAYATIIILTISAPFFFLFQALPGNNSAQTWFKQMAANISVFPAVAIMFILAGYLGNIEALGGAGEVFGSQQVAKFPLLAGDIDANVLGQLVGIGLLLMTPGAADMVKSTIGAKSQGGGALGAAAGAALGMGLGTATAPFKPVSREMGESVGPRARERAGHTGSPTKRDIGSLIGSKGAIERGEAGPEK